jgi:hypothetical protein
MKLSRRDLTGLAATGLAVQALTAQDPPAMPAPDWAKAARDAMQRNSETMAKFEVPMATEPAFLFKP